MLRQKMNLEHRLSNVCQMFVKGKNSSQNLKFWYKVKDPYQKSKLLSKIQILCQKS